MTTLYKIESGIQLLSRLTKKPHIVNFYPDLFDTGPKQGEVIELYSDSNISSLMNDIICEALLSMYFDGIESGILLINCSGNFNYRSLVTCLQQKIIGHKKSLQNLNDIEQNALLRKLLTNFFVTDIYDAIQLYTTIQYLDTFFLEHSSISILMFDTITAFYWTEQHFKITKMDIYIKNMLQMAQKVCKEHKITIFYSRPEYFSSSKDSLENLEPCSEAPSLEKVNHRIQVVQTKDNCIYHVNIRTFNKIYRKLLYMDHEQLNWIKS